MSVDVMSEVVIDEENVEWKVDSIKRLTACENRPGRRLMYVTVFDEQGEAMEDVKVRFSIVPSQGTAWDHPNVWGLTNERGYLQWTHLGVPILYSIWMGDDECPLIEGISTRKGYEYCRPAGTTHGGWRPINSPGIYSFQIKISHR